MRVAFKTVSYVNASKEKNGVVPIMRHVTIDTSSYDMANRRIRKVTEMCSIS